MSQQTQDASKDQKDRDEWNPQKSFRIALLTNVKFRFKLSENLRMNIYLVSNSIRTMENFHFGKDGALFSAIAIWRYDFSSFWVASRQALRLEGSSMRRRPKSEDFQLGRMSKRAPGLFYLDY